MPAREADQLKAEAVAPEVAPAEPEVAKAAEFSAEGELPAVAAGGSLGATASEKAFDGNKQEAAAKLDTGMHIHPDAYREACEAVGQPEKWQDQYRIGHTSAAGWVQPYERYKVYFEWQLQKGTSASTALQAFISGPTICDYRTAGVAHEMNTVRQELGDRKFDKLFGSSNSTEDQAIPLAHRLTISPGLYTTPLADNMRAIARAADERDKPTEEVKPAAAQEARVEEKPKAPELEQDPVVVAQELGMDESQREVI